MEEKQNNINDIQDNIGNIEQVDEGLDDGEFFLDIDENDDSNFIDQRTDEEKKNDFITRYKIALGQPIDEPKIYATDYTDWKDNVNSRTFLSEDNIVKYLYYKKKQKDPKNQFVNDITMMIFPSQTKQEKEKQPFLYSHQISEQIAKIINENNKKKGDIIRKVLFCKQNKDAHIACFVVFIDTYSNTNTIIATSMDAEYLKPLTQYVSNTIPAFIELQSDRKSCGIVALKMAKHLTKQWYYQHREMLWDSKTQIVPIDKYPPKLLSYKQQDLWKLCEEYEDIFKNLYDKQYIKHLKVSKKENNKRKEKGQQPLDSRIVNTKLQESKSRRLYENYYQKQKKQLDKNNKNYRQNKQKIVKEIENRFEKNINDSSNSDISSSDEEFIKYYTKPIIDTNKINKESNKDKNI